MVTTEDKAGTLLSGIVLGLVVCFFKKLGWTGFVVHELRKRYGIFATGLIMDLLWGAWHLSLFSGSAGSSGVLALLGRAPLLAPPGLQGTHGWGPVVMLIQAPLAGSQIILIPPAISAAPMVSFDLLFAAALWVVVGAVLVTNRRQISSQPR